MTLVRRKTPLVVMVLSAVALTGCASANARSEIVTISTPPSQQADPYAQAMSCVREQTLPEDRVNTIAVIGFPDRTGRMNLAAENGFGAFLSQAGPEVLIGAFTQSGVRVIEVGTDYRELVNWLQLQGSREMLGDGTVHTITNTVTGEVARTRVLPNVRGNVYPATFGVKGSFSTLDFITSSVAGGELRVSGIGINTRRHAIQIVANMYAIKLPRGDQVGGEVIEAIEIRKQVISDEAGGNIVRFVGPTLIQFDIGLQRREALQYAQMLALKYGAVQMAIRLYNVPQCQPLLDYANQQVGLE